MLLRQVREVAAELRPHLSQTPVTLDSLLDKDLGFDSLGRVELLVRIERAFGISLPDNAFANAETPRDLLRAVLGAAKGLNGAEGIPIQADIGLEAIGDAGDLPHGAATLTEVLDFHARVHPERPHIRFYSDEGDGETLSYRDLKEGAERLAAGLQRQGFEPGQSAVLMLPTGADYFFSFFGVLYAGGVPVPIYPPGRPSQIEEHLTRHAAIIDNAQCAIMITVPEAQRFAGLMAGHAETLKGVVTVGELMKRVGSLSRPVLRDRDIAFLQYTSGSTGAPKGVMLTHANLMANIRAMGEALEATPGDTFVSWLPLYHDMGLIGAWLGNLYYASPLVIMSPLDFLARPKRWLWAIHRARGTISAAPNFAYELCLNRIADKDIEGLDLSSWRLAINGAEAINPDTLQRFAGRFREYGFDAQAVTPVYGLAECSVGLAFPPVGRGLVIDRVKREKFMNSGRAEVADDADDADGADGADGRALRFVNCGRPLPQHQIRIVDDAGREVPERQQGRLQFLGPSATVGYFRNPRETEALFDGEWLNSGDLAYIAGGDVVITGRTKDLIIRGGRNIYPAELEDAIGDLDGVRKGNVAVFGSADPATGTERLVVLAETRKRKPEDQERLRSAINTLGVDLIGAPPDDVVLAPPRTVLKTSSGKIRRAACRELYEKGLIGKPPAAIWLQVARMTLASAGPRARKALRGVGVLLFGAYAWGLIGLMAPVLWLGAVIVPSVGGRWAGLGGGVRLLAWLLGARLSVRGLENLPPKGRAAVFVSNHASYLDAFILSAALPRPVRFVAKAELRNSWMTRVPLQRLQAEFVERFDRERGIDDAGRVTQGLRDGYSPLFFAEGTLSRMPGLLPFLMGAFVTAAEADAPIVPVIIRGTRSMLRDGSWLPRPGTITVIIGKTIEPDPAAGEEGIWARAVSLRDRARREILKHSGEPDLEREDSPVTALKEQP
ncbi:MAG: AMP-binding protein [Proteobacteria bacterium]|nr:AMP-binding protein [Pseudomonadota bacterium]